ncbi:hypothetical protein [Candidatus Palauibacter polyketidifaciens]|uniref:hypothetical protein n=1 Tax=Candidatus Palauibacter polyketidifaciens TaxID=3056740 RepID=UPI0023971E98|nr:hypothetical protein [Candidatus Palauibacter polyketidifaciens]MDE2719268.1 hypothetical protein [Candidatus Palauibacter polyketidifaciens]
MTTPAHAALSLIVLGRSERNALPVALGAVAPDVPMLVFYAWERLVRGVSEGRIWSERYFDPGWQVVFDIPSSIPLLGIAICILLALIGRRSTAGHIPSAGVAAAPRPARLTAWALFIASMIIHALGDLPLHREDAHRHFFPFSDWRFTSPVSYWDPEHYGGYAAVGEVILVLAVSIFLFRAYRGRGRWIVAGVAGIYALFIGFAVLVWSGL